MTLTPLSTVTNIDKFNYAALAILKSLYGIFPVSSDHFSPGKVVAEGIPKGGSDTVVAEFSNFGYHTFVWLQHAGFVRGNPNGVHVFAGACLTLRGYALLQFRSERSGPIQLPSFIEQIADALREDQSQINYKVISPIMEKLVHRMALP